MILIFHCSVKIAAKTLYLHLMRWAWITWAHNKFNCLNFKVRWKKSCLRWVCLPSFLINAWNAFLSQTLQVAHQITSFLFAWYAPCSISRSILIILWNKYCRRLFFRHSPRKILYLRAFLICLLLRR
jgi:hypothetical protein